MSATKFDETSRWIQFTGASIIIAFCLLLQSANVYGQSCSLATLSGSYAVTISGTNYQDPEFPNQPAPFAAIQMITFDGAGKFSGFTFTHNPLKFQRFPSKGSFNGTYTVKPDCTATFKFADIASVAVIILRGGEEYYSLAKNDGIVRLAIGKKR